MTEKEKAFAAAAGFSTGGEIQSEIDIGVQYSAVDEKVKTMTPEELMAVYRKNIWLIVGGIYKTLPRNAVEKEELFNIALIAVMEARERFNPKKKIKFVSYFQQAVRGAILDYLRKLDSLPRRERQILKFKKRLENEPAINRQRLIEEFAAKLKITSEKLLQLMQNANDVVLKPLLQDGKFTESSTETGQALNPHTNLRQEQARRILMEVLDDVIKGSFMEKNRERNKGAFLKYYYQGLTLKEVGKELGLEESRVNQILTEIRNKMKTILEERGINSTNVMFD